METKEFWAENLMSKKLPHVNYKTYKGKGRPKKSDYIYMSLLEAQMNINYKYNKKLKELL